MDLHLHESKLIKGLILLMVLLFFCRDDIKAQTISTNSWTGIKNSDWDNGQNWSLGVAPNEFTNIIIGDEYFTGTAHPHIDGKGFYKFCRSLEIRGGTKSPTLTINGGNGQGNYGGLKISGDVTIRQGGKLDIRIAYLEVGGNWINDGSFVETKAMSGNIELHCNVTLSGASKRIGGNAVTTFSSLRITGDIILDRNIKVTPIVSNRMGLRVYGILDPQLNYISFENSFSSALNFAVQAGGTIKVNAGRYKENYSHWSTLLEANSTIEYVAAANENNVFQTIYAPSSTEVPYQNLMVQGGGTRNMAGSILVEEGVIVRNGMILTGDNHKIVLGSSKGFITEERAGNYVVGTVETTRPLAAAPNSFGNIGIKITPTVDAGSTKVTRVTGKTVGTSEKSILRNFTVEPTSNQGSYNATMEFSYFDHELNGISDENSLMGHYSELYWNMNDWKPFSKSVVSSTESNVVTFSEVNRLGRYTLASGTNPLPVELISFTVSKNGEDAVLNWAVAREENNSGFEIQASTDGYLFEKIGFVESKGGSSSTRQDYKFIDSRNGKEGVIFYRLKQIDLSGKTTLFGPEVVRFNTVRNTELTAYSNPFNEQLKARLVMPESTNATLKLIDIFGKQYIFKEQLFNAGENIINIEASEIPAGMYIFIIEASGEAQKLKLIKQ